MRRFGIVATGGVGGWSVPDLRGLARRIGTDHGLGLRLWRSGVHEARLLATMVDDPALVTKEQMEEYARDFDSWDLVDQACSNLFDRTPFAHRKALEWSERDEEFVRRAGFALMAALAVHDRGAFDSDFQPFLRAIEAQSGDDRNFVKKAVNWALRQIGKRNPALRIRAIETAQRILAIGGPAGRWIARDALRELESERVLRRMAKQQKRAPGLRSPRTH